MDAKLKTSASYTLSEKHRALRVLPVLIPLFIIIGTGLLGLDFGLHWDEKAWQIEPVKAMVQTGILLPRSYIYPSFDYWINAAALIPDFFDTLQKGSDISETLLNALDSHEYLMRLRAIYLIITSLSILWIYLFMLHWRRSWIEALLAASLLAFSWEVAYHLRWVATDGMLMNFGALTLLCIGLSRRNANGRKWIWFAAITAGLGCGTKYPGGLLLIPVLFSGYFYSDTETNRSEKIGFLIKLFGLFVISYLIITPGTVLQPLVFMNDVLSEIKHYSSGHGGHSIRPGFEHAYQIFIYYSSVLFSPFVFIGILIFFLSIVGCFCAIKDSPKIALFIFSFMVPYFLYFSSQRVMVARNLLVVVPYLAVLAALGTGFLSQWLNQRRKTEVHYSKIIFTSLHAIFIISIIAALVINAGWLVYAAGTIADRNSDHFARKAASFMSGKKEVRFFLSPRARIHLASIDAVENINIINDFSDADYLVLYASEGVKRWHDWPANLPELTEAWFGPREVNFNIYPNWWGDDRLLIVPKSKAEERGIYFSGSQIDTYYVYPGQNNTVRSDLQTHSNKASWYLPNIDPCALLSTAEVNQIIGPVKEIRRGWILDGTSCAYIGEKMFIINLGLISTAAFELQRSEPESMLVTDLDNEAYTITEDPLGDLKLFVRGKDAAIVVNVARFEDGIQSSSSWIAKACARNALIRLKHEENAARKIPGN
jgi:4-amino-4-deoxy-L-arabinose transferase-like glycosyltransferase